MMKSFLLAAVMALSAQPSAALTQGDVVAAEFLTGWQTKNGTRMAAIHLVLAPGWKTYWRSPGDAGIPPLFDWSQSENLASVRFHWPRPHVFSLNGMMSIGYKDELVLPLELTAIDPSKPILLRASIELGVCLDICMPASLSLQSEVGSESASDPAISAALAARPASPDEAGMRSISCTVEPISDGLRITARLALPPTGGAETVVFEPAVAAWVSQSTVTRSGHDLVAVADLVPDNSTGFMLDRSRMTVTVLGRDRAVEISGCPAP
jgi:DsbC/DsbD-like thiol-disulfide interchange protein